MKRILVLLLACLLMTSSIGCSSKKTIDVSFEVTPVFGDKELKFNIITNLPENTLVEVAMTSENPKFHGTSSLNPVKKGVVTTTSFMWFNKKYLDKGTYTIVITTTESSSQSKKVNKALGESGENLTGKNVKVSDDGKKNVYVVKTLKIGENNSYSIE